MPLAQVIFVAFILMLSWRQLHNSIQYSRIRFAKTLWGTLRKAYTNIQLQFQYV